MLKRTCLTILLAFALAPAFSQQALLYRVSGNGLQQPGYLFGTIHLVCPPDFSLSPHVKEAINTAATIYFEVDFDDPALISNMMAGLQPVAGYNLQQYFSPADFSRLTAFWKDSLHASTKKLPQMKPMAVQMQLLQLAVPCKTPVSYEIELLKMAYTQKKPVMGLESLADQLAVFDAIPDSVEARMIMEYVNDFPKQRQLYGRMVDYYKKQDIGGLHALMSEAAEWRDYEDVLVYNRNRNWVPVIEKALQQGSAFFACGALHLGGEKGLIALLRAKGYEVTPVP